LSAAPSFTGDIQPPRQGRPGSPEGDLVTRIPGHTIADAPEASRPLLESVVQFSPTGKPLNLHAQMAG
jgi:hypothetical protein